MLTDGASLSRGQIGGILILMSGTTFLVRGLEETFIFFIHFIEHFNSYDWLYKVLAFLTGLGFPILGVYLIFLALKLISKRPFNISMMLADTLMILFLGIVQAVLAMINIITKILYWPVTLQLLLGVIVISLCLQCGTLAAGAWLIHTV